MSKLSLFIVLALNVAFISSAFSANPTTDAAAARQEELLSKIKCADLLAWPGGIEPPKVELDSNKIPYFVFQDIEQAHSFLSDVFSVTKNNPEIRARLLVPALNGFKEIYRKYNTNLTSRNKMELRAIIGMWYNTLDQIRHLPPLDDQTMEDLYQIAVRITGSDLYQPLKHSSNSANFSEIYSSLNRLPPEKQLKQWLSGYSDAMDQCESYSLLANILRFLPLLKLNESDTSRLVKAWMRKESRLDSTEFGLVKKGYALSNLYLLDPASAFNYFVRHKSQFTTLNLDKPQYIIRPLAYFKYVMKKDVPEFDTEYLKKIFTENNSKASSAENIVGSILSSFGIKFAQNTYSELAPFIELDFLTKLEDGRKVDIEVDGRYHFIKDENGNLRQRRLADHRRDEILEAIGIKVYRIPFYELDNLPATEERLMQFIVEGPKK